MAWIADCELEISAYFGGSSGAIEVEPLENLDGVITQT
jgi:hypothetical protein